MFSVEFIIIYLIYTTLFPAISLFTVFGMTIYIRTLCYYILLYNNILFIFMRFEFRMLLKKYSTTIPIVTSSIL